MANDLESLSSSHSELKDGGSVASEPDVMDEYERQTLNSIKSIRKSIEEYELKLNDDTQSRDETDQAGQLEQIAEFILQTILQLDQIDTKNSSKIREARKGVVIYAQDILHDLDTKFSKFGSKTDFEENDNNSNR